MCIIEVDDGSGVPKYHSVGKADHGLLGQGEDTKESKVFKPVLVPEGVVLTKLSIFADHALAVCSKGKLWAWGSNAQNRTGLTGDSGEGIFTPTHVPFVDGVTPVEVSTGLDHSLVLGKEAANGKTKLYSFGKDEANFKHLGCTKVEAAETVIHEITAFSEFNILCFSAATKYNQIIVEGEKEANDGLYEHQIGEKVSKGLMHAYPKNGEWIFIGEDELKSRQSELPDVSIAFKCPLRDAQKTLSNPKCMPSLDEIKLVAAGADKQFPTSSLSESKIDVACYSALTKINTTEQEVNLALAELLECTSFDLNPLIYFRLARPLEKDCKLPQLDLKSFYKTSSAYGIQFDMEADLSYQVNDKLIESTKTEYAEFVDLLKKFPEGKCDKELINAMNKQMDSITKDHDKIDPEKDFNTTSMKFDKTSKMKKVNDNVKKQRVKLIWQFNLIFVNVYKYLVAEQSKSFKGQLVSNDSAANLFGMVKHLILTAVKMKFVDKAIESLPKGDGGGSVSFNRHTAFNFKESGKIDHTGEFTVFAQAFQKLKAKTPKWDDFRGNDVDHSVFEADFQGEDAIDAGGPYREILSNIAEDLTV